MKKINFNSCQRRTGKGLRPFLLENRTAALRRGACHGD
jgi:hypothetical protein